MPSWCWAPNKPLPPSWQTPHTRNPNTTPKCRSMGRDLSLSHGLYLNGSFLCPKPTHPIFLSLRRLEHKHGEVMPISPFPSQAPSPGLTTSFPTSSAAYSAKFLSRVPTSTLSLSSYWISNPASSGSITTLSFPVFFISFPVFQAIAMTPSPASKSAKDSKQKFPNSYRRGLSLYLLDTVGGNEEGEEIQRSSLFKGSRNRLFRDWGSKPPPGRGG